MRYDNLAARPTAGTMAQKVIATNSVPSRIAGVLGYDVRVPWQCLTYYCIQQTELIASVRGAEALDAP